jgi:asparagine synthase (glutamine-hydrolysing)
MEESLEEFRSLLIDATRLRLRADVPVGAYLSGGLDSSILASIVRQRTTTPLETFSLAFQDPEFDESGFQQRMAARLGTVHQVVEVRDADIGQVFPEVIWHAETPLLRTAPAPMFLLSRRVRERGYKVVLTGEGADEFLAGYDLFKENLVRRFWARHPESRSRPRLLGRLYPDIPRLAQSHPAMVEAFFREGLGEVGDPYYSHATRWRNSRRLLRFLTEDLDPGAGERVAKPDLPPRFGKWHPLAQAQYLEIVTFLSPYLLSSQGDRMAMAHSIEGRFPFLDVRVVEFCNRLPPRLKLQGLNEKVLLKRLGREWLPAEIWQRRKRPYRAPIQRSFFPGTTPDYVRELLSPQGVRSAGLFKAEAVVRLVKRIEQGEPLGETDGMALAGILSTQLLHHHFVKCFPTRPPHSSHDLIHVHRHDASR